MSKQLIVHNVRLGFATNSSSTHSLIFLSGGAEDRDVDAGEFGWNYFTAGSEHSKRKYLAVLMYYSLRDFTTSSIAAIVASEWAGLTEGERLQKDSYGYIEENIDHQSVITLPANWEDNSIHEKFGAAFKDFLLQEEVVILGGNDNDDEVHPLYAEEHAIKLPLPNESHSKGLVARKDDQQQYWTLFNRQTGAKIRMSFADVNNPPVVTKSAHPELVDLKITDYCPMGCEFCYQDSTLKGTHGHIDKIYSTLRILSSLEVFEVAIGGGEPTLHPEFLQILKRSRDLHIVPNFTTRRLDWIRDPHFRNTVLELCGAFAFSAHNVREVRLLAAMVEEYEMPTFQINVQVVMGCMSDSELQNIMECCVENGLRLTLLGYKYTGRGKAFMPSSYRNWLSIAKAVHDKYTYRFGLGVDTVMAEQFDSELKAAGIDERFYTTKEGAFSMYYDAVTEKAGPSSFCPQDQMHKLDMSNYASRVELLKLYAQFV